MVEITSETNLGLSLWEVLKSLIQSLYFLSAYSDLLFHLGLFSAASAYLGVYPFNLRCLICLHLVVHGIPYGPFYFCRVGNGVPSFIPNVDSLHHLFLSWSV